MIQSIPKASFWSTTVLSSLALLASLPSVVASNITYVQGTDANGVTRLLADNRFPALYTGDFSDCMGGQSLMNVTAFDAAYYKDNMTVLFHLAGSTNLRNDSIMSMQPCDMRLVDKS
jgi:meiotic recombination protein REC8